MVIVYAVHMTLTRTARRRIRNAAANVLMAAIMFAFVLYIVVDSRGDSRPAWEHALAPAIGVLLALFAINFFRNRSARR